MPVGPQLISLSRESNDWPITFYFLSLFQFAVKHSMRVVLFSLFSRIKIIVKDTFFTNIAVLKCLHCCYVYLWSLQLFEHSHIKSQRLDRICTTIPDLQQVFQRLVLLVGVIFCRSISCSYRFLFRDLCIFCKITERFRTRCRH